MTETLAQMKEDLFTVAPALEKYRQETVLGDLWKAFSTRDRSIVTLAGLIARNQTIEMTFYLNLALDSGVKASEISEIIHRTIGDNGRGLLHFIGRNYPAVFSRWIRKHIFPGGFVPSLRESLKVLEPKNYSVLDVENLRMHYAKTLEHWLERFDKSRTQVAAMYDSRFVRAWRLYLAGSIAAFRVERAQGRRALAAHTAE